MTAREIALKALCSIEKSGTYINAALNEGLSQGELSALDKGLVTELVYGTVSNKSALDYIISKYSKVKLKKMTPWVLNILRMGIYQIYYMDKIPPSAACNESVKLAKKYSHGAGAGFVNGVLRASVRGRDEFSFPKTTDAVKDLSLEFSYPEWITKKIAEEYGIDACRALFEENRKPHPVHVRANSLKTDRGSLCEMLQNEGLECSLLDDTPYGVAVSGKLDIQRSAAYRDGLFSLQNISSQRTAEILSPSQGEFIIDMCSAPGGKSCAIAEAMKNQGKILSFDLYEHKIELIKKTAKRLGIEIIHPQVRDASKVDPDLVQKADRVLVDVPCSGLGVIHKKPDIKWLRTPEEIARLCKIQGEILETAALYVKSGGVLVYSTCTILPEENRLRTQEFLKRHLEFEKVFEEQILTSSLGESGFYICKMVKKKD